MKFSKLFFLLASSLLLIFSYRFFIYTYHLFFYSFEWEPTDGDHLNFIVRLLQHKSIYIDKSTGWILSIYNPLYHYTICFFSTLFKTNNILRLARQFSIVFTLAPAGLFFIFNIIKESKHLFLILYFSLLIFFPSVDMYLLDLTNVAPNSFLIFLFTLTVFLIDKYYAKSSDNFILSAGISILCILVYLSKQQGIIIFPIYFVSIIFLNTDCKNKLIHIFIGIICLVICIGWLEYQHNGLFLKSTLFDAGAIVQTNYIFSIKRLLIFSYSNIIFILVAIYYCWMCLKFKKFDIWVISFVLHWPFLLKILGNAGGGNNYFGTFWITLIVLNYKVILHMLNASKSFIANTLSFIIFANALYGLFLLNKNLDFIKPPTEEIEVLYLQHVQSVKKITDNLPRGAMILAKRNLASLVNLGLDVNIEGATTFDYLWSKPYISDSINIISKNIITKKYSLIFQGIQPFPKSIESLIHQYYNVEKKSQVNLYYNNIGEIILYTPKKL